MDYKTFRDLVSLGEQSTEELPPGFTHLGLVLVNSTVSNLYSMLFQLQSQIFAMKDFPSREHLSDSVNGYFKMRLSGTTSFVVCPLADTRTLSCDFVRVTVEDVQAQVYLSTQQQRAFLQITVELRPSLLHKYHHYKSWPLVGCTFYLIWK